MFCNDDETQRTKNFYIEKKKRKLSVQNDIEFDKEDNVSTYMLCDSFKKLKLSDQEQKDISDNNIKKLEIQCNGSTWFSTFPVKQK